MEYANLTRGVWCPHISGVPSRYTRIQSTACEQKNWPDVIHGAGPDLLMHIALGEHVIVHDLSERDRETRAMWQGLTFVRRVCERFWHLPLTPIRGRGGSTMEAYFDEQIPQLPTSIKRHIRHFGKYVETDSIALDSCWRVYD